MKKVFLLLIALCTLATIYQCKDEHQLISEKSGLAPSRLASMVVISPNSSNFMNGYVSSNEFKEFSNRHGFESKEYFQLKTDNNEEFFAVQLKRLDNQQNLKEYYLVIYPNSKNGGSKSIVFEQEMGGESAKLTVFDAKNYTWLAEGTFLLNSSGEKTVTDRLCSDTTNSFGECFSCAWGELTNDWIGTAACATNPWSCAAAATLHCSGHI